MYTFKSELWLPRSRREVFRFFSDARHLNSMTPAWLAFDVLTPLPVEMSEGTAIDYRMRWRWLRLPWRSVVTTWEPPSLFTYRQARGPYRRFLHEHRYEEQDGGTLVIDELLWSPWGGWLAAPLVRRDLAGIFRYRNRVVTEAARRGPLDGTLPKA